MLKFHCIFPKIRVAQNRVAQNRVARGPPVYHVTISEVWCLEPGLTDQKNFKRTKTTRLIQTCSNLSRLVLKCPVRDFYDVKMLWTLLSKASTMIFCCIMSVYEDWDWQITAFLKYVRPWTDQKLNQKNRSSPKNIDSMRLHQIDFFFRIFSTSNIKNGQTLEYLAYVINLKLCIIKKYFSRPTKLKTTK